MAKLLFQGHGSLRLRSKGGTVLYVDPYAGEGYDLPADIILVTHAHPDHTETGKCAKKSKCTVITYKEALKAGNYNAFNIEGVKIVAVAAGGNAGHSEDECVGFVLTIDDKKVYISGDTSYVENMNGLKHMKLDYALLCCDGVYNMDLEEAAKCAAIIAAKNTIPYHMKAGALFDAARAKAFKADHKIILEPGQEIVL